MHEKRVNQFRGQKVIVVIRCHAHVKNKHSCLPTGESVLYLSRMFPFIITFHTFERPQQKRNKK